MGLAMALVVGAVVLSPARAHAMAAAPVDDADGLALAVKVDPEMLQGEAHRGWVEARGREVLERRPGALQPGDRILVELAGTTRNYRVEIRVLLQGEPLASQPEPFVCKGSSDELLALVETAIDDAVDRLIEARKAEQAEQERQAEERVEQDREAQAKADEAARRKLAETPYRPARLGLGGAVAMGLGGALVVSGAVVTSRGAVPSGNDLLGSIDFRPPGYALLGVGSAVLMAGLAVLVVDVVRCKKDRAACGERGPLRRRSVQSAQIAQGVLRW